MRKLLALIVCLNTSLSFADVNCRGMDIARSYEVNIIDTIIERAALVTIDDETKYISVAMNVKDDTVNFNGMTQNFSLVIDRFQDAQIYQGFMTYEEYSVPLECRVY